MTACLRCGRPFEPQLVKLATIRLTRHCEDCGVRNILDGLGLPTPPGMLDRHTRRPALTDEEFRRKLHEPGPEEGEE